MQLSISPKTKLDIISFVIGIVSIVFGLFHLRAIDSFLSTALETQGEVVALVNSSGGTRPPVVQYRDEKGNQHRFTPSSSSDFVNFKVGEKVSVLYSPIRPEARVKRMLWLDRWFFIIFGVIWTGAVLAGWLGLISYAAEQDLPR